jgi:hypothetical protein
VDLQHHKDNSPSANVNRLVMALSIIAQQDANLYSFYSLQTAPHVSGDTFTHNQERK